MKLTAVPLSDVRMRSIQWLEKPLWQDCAFQLLVGPKGSGKGTYLAALASRLSHAGRQTVFVSTEDSTEIDLKPRYVAAGGIEQRCHVIRDHVMLPDHVDDLHNLCVEIGNVGLLVIDPVANHIGNARTNDEGEVRNAVGLLNKLADDLGCLVIGVRHPGKDRTNGALASVLGSTAWVDLPRAVVMIAKDDVDDDLRHIQVVAGNRAKGGAAQAFRIEAADVDGLTEPVTRAVILGASGKSVEQLLSVQHTPSRSQDARERILEILATEGEQESNVLDQRVSDETGLAIKTVQNTRGKLKSDGFIRNVPDKDEHGVVLRWLVYPTQKAAA